MKTEILYWLRRRKGVVRALPLYPYYLVDNIYISPTIYKTLKEEKELTDSLRFSLSLLIPIKTIEQEDGLTITDLLSSQLKKITQEDSLKVHLALINALLKLEKEDSLAITDSLKESKLKCELEDSLGIDTKLIKATEQVNEISIADNLHIGSRLAKQVETALEINLEDSLAISDVLSSSVKVINLEDSINVTDILKSQTKILELTDSLSIGDKLQAQSKPIELEDSLTIGDKLKVQANKNDLEDSLAIGDSLKFICLDNDIMSILSRFKLYVEDTGETIKGNESEWVKVKKCNGFYWVGFEDMKGQSNPDYDYEDVILIIKETFAHYVIDVYHGEHSYTNKLYYDNELIAELKPRGGSKVQECSTENAGYVTTIRLSKATLKKA